MQARSIREVNDRLEVIASRLLDGDVGWTPRAAMVPSLGAGMVFARFRRKEGGDVLVALRSAGRGVPMVEAYRCPAPARMMLAHDTSARRAFAVVDHGAGIQVVELGPDPPAFVDAGPVHEIVAPFANRTWCMSTSEENTKAIYQYVALRKLAPDARAAEIQRLEAAAGDDPAELLKVFQAVLHGAWYDPAAALLARIDARHPGDPRVLVARFTLLAARYAFAELVPELEAAGPGRFSGQALDHFHHLLALSRAALGDLDEARRQIALADASAHPMSPCLSQLKPLRAALDALVLPVTDEDLALDRPTVRQHVAVLRAADERLAAGDPAGAVAILERPLIWDVHEAQSLARLAAAYLDLPSPTAGDRLRKALALATFFGCVASSRVGERDDMLAPGTAYGEARIEALRSAALAWLEADQGVPRAPMWIQD